MKTILHTEASMGLGGQEFRTLQEMDRFRKKGYRVLLACQPGSHILRLGKEQRFPVFPVKMRTSVDPVAIGALAWLMKKEKVAILHTHSSLDSWTAGIAGRLTGIPLIVRTRHVSIPVKNKWVYTWLADRVITTSDSIKNYLGERCGINGDRIISIPTGIDLNRFNPETGSGEGLRGELSLSPDNVLIGIVGMIRWCKGLDIFLRAAKSLTGRFPLARFVVVGFDPDGQIDFNEEIKKQGLENAVFYLGFRKDVPEILSSLDILTSPSTAAEGISQAILQGLAMKIPVVATRIGGTPEVIHDGKTGLLIPPNEDRALAEAIAELIQSPEKRAFMGENGARLIKERFSIETMIDRLERIYS